LSKRARIAILTALSIAAYLPTLGLPFIADDYHQIPVARQFAMEGWRPLLNNPELRTRATYMFLSATLDAWFGFRPLPFYAVSILLHAACTIALYLLTLRLSIEPTAAFWTAAFFAIHEGHQEAVMWLAASHGLLVFLFGTVALIAWTRWIDGDGALWYALSLAAIIVAALSQEAFWVFVALMGAVAAFERRRKAVLWLVPFAALSIAYLAFMYFTRVAPGTRLDDRFTFHSSTWPIVALNSLWRLLWPQGIAALAVLIAIRRRVDRSGAAFAAVWMIIGIAPYTFLTYMRYVSSRHTYVASAGLALLIGIALARLSRKIPRPAFLLVSALLFAINLEILWVKKMAQFRERGEPTELLKAAAREATGPITIDCIPVPALVADWALRSAGSTAIFRNPETHRDRCFAIEYRDRNGAIVRQARTLGTSHGLLR
jgi:hypothetical protein